MVVVTVVLVDVVITRTAEAVVSILLLVSVSSVGLVLGGSTVTTITKQ